MDQLVSQLIPTQRIGNDGFNWWVGQIEGTARDEKNNKGGYRYKVRIVGDHPKNKELLDTKDLPWANVMMPVNVPFLPGNSGGGHPSLEVGCWVVGFYLDPEKQKPIIMGSIGQTPGATTILNERTPDTEPLTTAISQVNGSVDGAPVQEGTGKNTATGGLSDGTVDGDGNQRVAIPPKKATAPNEEKWCQSVAEKCDKEDIKTKTTILLGEFLSEVQKSNGNIGTYLVSPINGTINSGISIARKYVNKFMKVIRHFVAKVKGFVIEKLTNAVKDLINALLYPSDTGNILTPVTEWFNNILKDLGCQMADLGDRLSEWLTNVLMGYVNQIYRAAACQVDALVNGILSKMNSLMEDILGKVLGPIQDILGAIAGPLNILGGAINFVLNLLGISCSGPSNECAKYKSICTDGEKKDDDNDDKDFLDNLLGDIDNLFPATGADYTQYVCSEAYTGKPLNVTTIGFVGGVPKSPTVQKISYNIDDILVEEGKEAVFTVTRSGSVDIASSVTFKTLKGTAKEDVDYLKTDGILGFTPGETSKTISVSTLYSQQAESSESFYMLLRTNSPATARTEYVKNIGRCVIVEANLKEPNDPYSPTPTNPITDIPIVFPPGDIDFPSDYFDEDTDENSDVVRYSVKSNVSSIKEGGFVIYTITTRNVENGTILYYTLSGNGITSSDIIGSNLTGNFTITNNQATVTVGIEEDGVVESSENLRFTVNGTGASADVLIIADDDSDDEDVSDYDEGGSDPIDDTDDADDTNLPVIDPDDIVTDPNGGIIDIPISDTGDPWEEPPYVFIGGEGIGATATPLLDNDGYITEIRVKSPGYGYKLNLSTDKNLRCIIDSFTVLQPGSNYTSKPTIYVNGELNVAEAIINDDGFVIGATVLNREKTFTEMPEIVIVGGNGYGAKLLPSLACLDIESLTTIGGTKIGTGRYVDCP